MNKDNKAQNADAQVVMRVTPAQKNAWVKASQSKGKKLTDFLIEKIESSGEKMENLPALPPAPVLNLSALPARFRENWGTVLMLRSDSLVSYAATYANSVTGEGSYKDTETSNRWCAAFDRAERAWLDVNPLRNNWPFEPNGWPDDAAILLGNTDHDEARRILWPNWPIRS